MSDKMAAEPSKPLITIITATYNAAEHLPNAIKSVREQTYGNIEWIVVDGASIDGTLDLPTTRRSDRPPMSRLGQLLSLDGKADVIAVALMNWVLREKECAVRCLLNVKAAIGLHGSVSQ